MARDLPLDFSKSEIVKVLVGDGPEPHVFHVHKTLLCDQVPFFKGALTGEFQESKTNSVSLPDDDPDLFAEVLRWIYRPTLPDLPFGMESLKKRDQAVIARLELYVLADKLCMEELATKITTSIRGWIFNEGIVAEFMLLLRERGLSHSLLQGALIRRLAHETYLGNKERRNDFLRVLEGGGVEAVETFKRFEEYSGHDL